jgi:FtsZ-binding cell division protein ZapB
MLQLADL